MKSLQQLLFIGLAIALMLTSCTMEKRVYMPGYYTEWNKSKHNSDRQQLVSNVSKTKNQTVTVEQSGTATNTFDNSFTPTVTDDNITASLDNNSVIIPSHETVAFDKKINAASTKTNSSSETKISIPNKKELKNTLRKINANSASGDEGGSGALSAFGWIVLIVGFLVLLFASIIGGALLMLLGLLIVIAGSKKGDTSSKPSNKPDKSEYVDVLYLKNGSVIRGMIFEQIPNVSIKIQTKDGSIFVYKMEEVEKMTKELSK